MSRSVGLRAPISFVSVIHAVVSYPTTSRPALFLVVNEIMTKNEFRVTHITFAFVWKTIREDIAVSHIIVGPECFCLTDWHHACRYCTKQPVLQSLWSYRQIIAESTSVLNTQLSLQGFHKVRAFHHKIYISYSIYSPSMPVPVRSRKSPYCGARYSGDFSRVTTNKTRKDHGCRAAAFPKTNMIPCPQGVRRISS